MSENENNKNNDNDSEDNYGTINADDKTNNKRKKKLKKNNNNVKTTNSLLRIIIIILSIIIFLLIIGYLFLIKYALARQKLILFKPDCEVNDLISNNNSNNNDSDNNDGESGNSNKNADITTGIWNKIYYYFINKFPNHPVILFFHGSTGNVSTYLPHIKVADDYEYNVLLAEYRGYGKSSCGKFSPTEKSLCEDGQIAYDFLVKHCKIPPSKIIVWGMSLGGLPASYVAANNKIGALVLFSTFSDVDSLVTGYRGDDVNFIDRILYVATRPFLYKLNVANNLRRVNAPIIILHNQDDEVISYKNALKNYNSISKGVKDVEFINISGIHSKPQLTPIMLKRLFDFLNRNVN